jgi:hypothetical protein
VVGEQFGRLSVVAMEKRGRHICAKCVCECGEVRFLRKGQLRSGLAKSCGCAKIHAYTPGDTVGRLTVLEYVGRKRWRFKCSCGTEVVRRGGFNRKGSDSACRACLNKDQSTKTGSKHSQFNPSLEHNRSGFGQRYNTWKKNAATRGYRWGLSPEFLLELWNKQDGKCAYSGRQMTKESGAFETVSLDRKNSSLDYTPDNVVLCCAAINEMKMDLPLEVFIVLCSDVARGRAA